MVNEWCTVVIRPQIPQMLRGSNVISRIQCSTTSDMEKRVDCLDLVFHNNVEMMQPDYEMLPLSIEVVDDDSDDDDGIDPYNRLHLL